MKNNGWIGRLGSIRLETVHGMRNIMVMAGV